MSCDICIYFDDNHKEELYCDYHKKIITDVAKDCDDFDIEELSIFNLYEKYNAFKHISRACGACVEEYKKLLKIENEEDLYKIVFDNIEWINDNNILKEKDISFITSDFYTKDDYKDMVIYYSNEDDYSVINTLGNTIKCDNIFDNIFISRYDNLLETKINSSYGIAHVDKLDMIPTIYDSILDIRHDDCVYFIASKNKFKTIYRYDISTEECIELQITKVEDELPTGIHFIPSDCTYKTSHFILVYKNTLIKFVDETGFELFSTYAFKDKYKYYIIDCDDDKQKLFFRNDGLLDVKFDSIQDLLFQFYITHDKNTYREIYYYKNQEFLIDFNYKKVIHVKKYIFGIKKYVTTEFNTLNDLKLYFDKF